MANKAGQMDVELKVDVAPDAGSFEGDAAAIRAMLVNVIENSLDACRAAGREIERAVNVQVRCHEPWMIFDIRDNGIGMDRETREKIFSLFFSSKGAAGTGLGLFIASRIATAHGGTIDLESEPGAGTRFVVRLPRERPAQVEPDSAPSPQPGASNG